MAKGFFVSTTIAVVIGVVVVVLLVAEGLLIGLLLPQSYEVPNCDTNPSPSTSPGPITSTTSPAATTTVPIDPDRPWTNPRLPDDLKPESYVVTLRPEFREVNDTYWFYGSSSIVYKCVKATKYVILHSRTLLYPDGTENVEIEDVNSAEQITISDVWFYEPNDYMIVNLTEDCTAGTDYEIVFTEFWGELGDDLDGLYRSEYVNEAGETRVIATSQMQTDGARQTFPCFDEPSFKAKFTISLLSDTSLGYFGLSNMPDVAWEIKEIRGVSYNETTFDVTPVMSTYLLAMIVSDFEYQNSYLGTGEDPIRTRIYARKVPVDNQETKYAAEKTPQMIEVFSNHLNVTYDLPKSDQVAVPDFGAGAMENWGLVIYREIYLLFSDTESSVFNRHRVAHVISHELAHQWFGNLVTCAWWNDIWLNEGFASYFEYIGVKGVHPEWKEDEVFVVDDLQDALAADAYNSSHPLHHPQGYFTGDITYSKGASVLRMISDFLGESVFTDAITKYLNNFSYGVASYTDLFEYLVNEADLHPEHDFNGIMLNDILETWILQMGYPLVTVKRSTGNLLNVEVTQEYFLIDSNETAVSTPGSDKYGYKWHIPFTYMKSSLIGTNANATYQWMKADDSKFQMDLPENEFVLANINAVGFYRVQYGADLWTMIVDYLIMNNHTTISAQNRAQLIDDVFAIARSGRLNVTNALDITRYLKNDSEYIPWKTFLDNMVLFDRMLAGSNIFGDLSNYILELLDDSIYVSSGWDEPTSDAEQMDIMARGIGVEAACHFENPDCVGQAVTLYQQWMNNPTANPINATYREAVYCTAIREGGVEEWDFAWNQYENVADNAHEKTRLRYAMSCSAESWIINRYIERCLNPSLVRKQDVSSTMSYIGSHENTKYDAWSFAYNNWERLNAAVGSSAVNSMLSSARRRFSTEFDLDLIKALREKAAGSYWVGRLNDYQNTVENNIAWRMKNEKVVGDWLNSAATPLSSDKMPPRSTYTEYNGHGKDASIEDRGFLKPY